MLKADPSVVRQKFISIYMRDIADNSGAFTKHKTVEEHLGHYAAGGWRVKQFTTLSGNSSGQTDAGAGWIIVLLEK